ncbi:hypothetical protein [Mycolicibacterium pyrenivorans]|nr:hypothetical protein [Mycolicibacterium pyrenivorans]
MNNELPELAAWDLPDTDICSAAWQLAFDVIPGIHRQPLCPQLRLRA